MNKLILAVLINNTFSVAIAGLGIYLLKQDHTTLGTVLIFIGIFSLNIIIKDKD